MDGSSHYRIKVLGKTLNILDLFDEKGKELSAAQINDQLGLNKSTSFRILRQLEEAGYLERSSESLKFRLGFKLYHLGSLVEGITAIRRLAHPFLEELAKACDETVHLVVLHGGEALYLDKIEGRKAVRVVSRIGWKLPAHCSGVGKALLASLPDAAVGRIIREKGLRRFTANTITDREALRRELSRIRERGYAIDNEEIEVGLKCVAAPVRDGNGEVIAAISISGPKERFQDTDLESLIPLVKRTAEEISAASGKNHLSKEALSYQYG